MNFTGTSDSRELRRAGKDFRWLLNRGYPRKASLELVGNRFGFSYEQRHLLHRGVFSGADTRSRRKKKIPIRSIRNKKLAIDGYNVIITIEAALCGKPLVMGDDGFVRDISGVSGNFRRTESTEQALRLIIEWITKKRPSHSLFLFDSPISKSGSLAREVRSRLANAKLPGDAQAVKVPEKILIGFPGVVATSDTAIIDQSEEVVDLAGHIIRQSIRNRQWTKIHQV